MRKALVRCVNLLCASCTARQLNVQPLRVRFTLLATTSTVTTADATVNEKETRMNIQLPTVGGRVRILNWGPSEIIDDNLTVPPGTEGTVTYVTRKQFGVRWDNGSILAPLVGYDDYELIWTNESGEED